MRACTLFLLSPKVGEIRMEVPLGSSHVKTGATYCEVPEKPNAFRVPRPP